MITVLIGPQASGKSTYARDAALKGALVVNDDDIYMMLHAHNYELWAEELNPLYKTIETSAITAALLAGRDVIIDRPNTQKATRQRYIALARAFDQFARAVVFRFDTPEVHARRRYVDDPRGLTLFQWQKACERVIHQYQPPTLDEGFAEIEYR